MLIEIAARNQRNPHRADVSPVDETRMRQRRLPFRVCYAAHNSGPTPVAAERQGVGDPGRLNAGYGLHASDQAVVESDLLCSGSILPARIDAPGGGSLWPEAEIDVKHPEKTADEQSRAGEQDACQRHLGHDQYVPSPGGTPALT